MSQNEELSARGRRLLASPPLAEYIAEDFQRSSHGFDPRTNPQGYIGLCVAENRLVWDLLEPRMRQCRDVPHRALCYDSMVGAESFRQELARFLGARVLNRQIDAENVAVLAGAGSVLEILFYALADPGDAVLVPTPSYAGFWADLETRDELSIVPVPCDSRDGFRLETERLDRAMESTDRPVRALIFTSPDNPRGKVYSKEEVEEILAWSEDRGIHLVLDEVYALSVFGERQFVSGASLRPTLGPLAHVVWAFSKDFGASGLRCGVLVSENREVLQAVDALAYWACCSGDTQYLLEGLIADDDWVDGYVDEMQARLRGAYVRVTEALQGEGIPYLPGGAGFFLLVDVRSYLPKITREAEDDLWRRLLDEGNVNLTPGSACRIGEPGFLRLCFAGQPTETVLEGIGRMGAVLRGERWER